LYYESALISQDRRPPSSLGGNPLHPSEEVYSGPSFSSRVVPALRRVAIIMQISEAIDQFTNWKSFNVKGGTMKGYDLTLKQFALFQRNKELEQTTIDDVMTWFNMMKDLGWAQNSFVPKAIALRKFFEYFRDQGLFILNPRLIPVPRKEYNIPRVATEENYHQLLKIIPFNNDPRHIRNRAMINLLWDTGARNGEICALDIADIDAENKKAIIKTEKSKGRRPIREIFWTDPTNENIKVWLEKRKYLGQKGFVKDAEALFISVCNQKFGFRMQNGGVCEMMRKYSNRAGLPYMNAHSFRHHMGHDIIKKGGSNADVSGILGHSSLQSSFVYTMMADKELEGRYRHFIGK
jgi:integrase/recombinase XerC